MPSVRALVLSLLIGLSATPAVAGVIRIDRITLTVADLARTEQFYRDAFGFTTVRQGVSNDPPVTSRSGTAGVASCSDTRYGQPLRAPQSCSCLQSRC